MVCVGGTKEVKGTESILILDRNEFSLIIGEIYTHTNKGHEFGESEQERRVVLK